MKSLSGILLIAITIFMVSLNTGCKTTGLTKKQEVKQFKNMYWLVGKWQNVNAETTMTEDWRQGNDTLLLGKSTMLMGNDTVYAEDIKLAPSGINISYSIISHSSDKTERSSYILKKNRAGKLVFENPANKEQSRISYIRISNNNIVLKVEGMEGTKMNSEVYGLSRVIK